MERGQGLKEGMENVDCAPFLQRLILEDPDPSSPLYIPKPPPRNYETLSKAIAAGSFVDKNPVPAPEFMEATRGVKVRDRRAVKEHQLKARKAAEESSKVQREMAEFHRGMDFAEDSPFSMGGTPFGGGGPSPFGGGGPSPFGGGRPSPLGGDGGWGPGMDEDPFSGIGEPLYPDTPQLREKAESQFARAEKYRKSEDVEDQEDEGPDMTADENYNEGEEQGGEEDEGEVEEGDVQDESGYRYSEPMYAPGDEQLMQDAQKLRETDGIPYHESQDIEGNNTEETGYTNPVAEGTGPDGTGSGMVPNVEGTPPRKRLKEKFMRDRERLEKMMNAQGDSIYRRAGDPLPVREPPGNVDPDDPSGIPTTRDPRMGMGSRIMSGPEIKQQMAMQKLAAAALKAISQRGKGKKGGRGRRGGRVRVMFM